MIGQPPRARLRLVASNPPVEDRTARDLYLRLAATRETDPERLPPGYAEDYPDDLPDEAALDYARYFELVAGLALGVAIGAFILAAIYRL